MPEEATIFVRDRRDDEDVVEWLEGVASEAIGDDHRERSPFCRATATEYVKIPVDKGDNATIGRLTRN